MINTTRGECNDFSGHSTVCAQCGYRFVSGERGLWIKQTGDVVHKDCFVDYTEDNVYEFTDEIGF